MAGVQGRVVAVTGAGNGLGRRYALVLAAAGARVVVNDLGGDRSGDGSGTATADAVVEEITAAGGEAVACYDSVADAAGGAAVVRAAIDAFGRIDGVVSNAGILRDRSFHKMTADDWDAVLRVHLHGSFHVIHAAWPHLRGQGHGRIVVATSTSGIYGKFGQVNYAAAKGGLLGMVQALAIEGQRHGIGVNAIAPMAATRMTADIATPEVLAALDPAHVAPVVGYLLADECTETGGVLVAGGGEVHRVRQFRGTGVRFDGIPTIDEVGARWAEITDLDGAVPGTDPTG